jgi:hypothetical protein
MKILGRWYVVQPICWLLEYFEYRHVKVVGWQELISRLLGLFLPQLVTHIPEDSSIHIPMKGKRWVGGGDGEQPRKRGCNNNCEAQNHIGKYHTHLLEMEAAHCKRKATCQPVGIEDGREQKVAAAGG